MTASAFTALAWVVIAYLWSGICGRALHIAAGRIPGAALYIAVVWPGALMAGAVLIAGLPGVCGALVGFFAEVGFWFAARRRGPS